MKKMEFKSNTKGKLNKIIKGMVFDSPETFITELFQNSYRAKANRVDISIDDNLFILKDNGCGLKSIKSLLTFDYSEWKSTDEGFGIGFWSVLGIPNLKYIKIRSGNFSIFVDIELAKTNLQVNVNDEEDFVEGFTVELNSSYFKDKNLELIDKIKYEGQYMLYDVFLNKDLIERKNIFEDVSGQFTKSYNNKYFEAVLAVSKEIYAPLMTAYELREVSRIYEGSYVSGMIAFKKNAVTLKEPDRKDIVSDKKYSKFRKKLKECIIDLYKSFLNEQCHEEEVLNEYASAIAYNLSSKEYENFLLTDNVLKKENSINKSMEDSPEIETKIQTENIEEVIPNLKEINNIQIGDKVLKKVKNQNTETINIRSNKQSSKIDIVNNDELIDTSDYCGNHTISMISEKRNNTQTIKDFIKKNKNIMWVEIANCDKFYKSISLAEYYGVTVLRAKNILFENFLKENNIIHIKYVENAIVKNYSMKDMLCKTQKEKVFLTMLEPIRTHYKLKEGIFKIAIISEKITLNINKNVSIKNSKQNNIDAVTYKDEIIFNRRALNLKQFKLSATDEKVFIGKNELKCIMYHLNTIAHELAHLLYGTTDNTENHRNCERMLEKEIIDIYLKL